MDGGDVDDAAFGALQDHLAGGGLGAEEGSGEVNGDDFLPEVEGEIDEGALEFDAGVVDEDVEFSESGNGLGDEVLDLGGVGDVGGDGDGAASEGLDLGECVVGAAGLADVVDDYGGALTGECGGDGLADAGGGSGDDGDFSLEGHVSLRRGLAADVLDTGSWEPVVSASVAGPWFLVLEDEFSGELDTAGAAAAEEGVADAHVTGGCDLVAAVADFAVSASGKSEAAVAGDRWRRLAGGRRRREIGSGIGDEVGEQGTGEVGMVKEVEEFGAQLEMHFLRDRRVFVDGQIPLLVGRADQGVAAQVSVVARAGKAVAGETGVIGWAVLASVNCAGQGEGGQVEEFGGVVFVIDDLADDIGAVEAVAAAAVIVFAVVVQGEGLAALE